MLSQNIVKAPYFPGVFLQTQKTRFGALEVDKPELYHTKVAKKITVRVDALTCLKELWGEEILTLRNLTYRLVSGSCSDNEYRKLLVSYYARYPKFTDYVDEAVLYNLDGKNLISRIIKPARELINNEIELISEKIVNSGGKIVMVTHDYVYAIYSSSLPEWISEILHYAE